MKIGPEDNRASMRRRWGVPLGVATGVTAVSVAAVVGFGGAGDAKPSLLSDPAGNPTGAAASPSQSEGQGDQGQGDQGKDGQGKGPSPSDGAPSARRASGPDAYTLTSGATTPIGAGTTARILASCLGGDASRYHAVTAVRTPVASKDWDGVVVAVDSAGQYVQCLSKGDKGKSQASPPTFINDRLWSTGRTIEYFDSFGEPALKGQYLMLGAGHYASGVAKITISYGDNPKQYPAAMAGGAFVYGAALTPAKASRPGDPFDSPMPYVHAFDAAGKEIYNQKKDPQFT